MRWAGVRYIITQIQWHSYTSALIPSNSKCMCGQFSVSKGSRGYFHKSYHLWLELFVLFMSLCFLHLYVVSADFSSCSSFYITFIIRIKREGTSLGCFLSLVRNGGRFMGFYQNQYLGSSVTRIIYVTSVIFTHLLQVYLHMLASDQLLNVGLLPVLGWNPAPHLNLKGCG